MLIFSIPLILLLIVIDYSSKLYIKSILTNEYIMINNYISFQIFYNKGVAFSIFNSESIIINYLILLIIIFIIGFIINIFYKTYINICKAEKLSYILILGGALGNLLDRIINGSVLDFIIIGYKDYYFPAIFNLADIFISTGVFIMLIIYLIYPNYDHKI